MVRFAGYAKKEDPKWITVMVYSAVVVFAFLLLFIISFLSQWFGDMAKAKASADATSTTASTTSSSLAAASTVASQSTVTTQPVAAAIAKRPGISDVVKSQPALPASSGLTVTQIVLSSAVAGNQPTDDIAAVSISAGKIYCFTRVKCQNPPQRIEHVWIKPDGTVYTGIDLSISREETFTWSYITLSNSYAGEWSVEVRDSSGAVIGKKVFTITE